MPVEVDVGLPADGWAEERAIASDDALHTALLDHQRLEDRYHLDGDLVASTLEDEQRGGATVTGP